MDDSQAAADPRSTDATSRYLLPYPIAALYRLMRASHRDGDRFGFALKLGEGIIRFLALCNLADAASRGVDSKKVREWLKTLSQPGFGKLSALFKSASGALLDGGGAFVGESLALCEPGPWQGALSALIEVRNRFTHDEIHVRDEEARPLLRKVVDPMNAILAGIQFLRHYRLGFLEHLNTTGSGEIRYVWYGARGLEETCEPIVLRSTQKLIERWPMLIDVRRGEALYLAPYFLWGLAEGDRASHFFWLQHLIDDDTGAPACYRHSCLRQDVTRGFPDPDDPDGDGVTLDVYLDRRARWPGRKDLQLDEESLRALRDPLQPICFEERYELVGRLGEGGMGTVWEAMDRRLGRRCAIKVLRPDLLRSPDALRRFDREGRLLAGLRDPRVVEVFSVEIGRGNVPYLVMELVEGEDLEAMVQREGPRAPTDAVALLSEAMEALQVAHDAGIVHRDVKPSNFMSADNSVRIVDFGIAVSPRGTRLTRGPDLMGTEGYMAPEQRAGVFSVRSDVFAAGRLLFFLLAGRCPRDEREKLRDAAPSAPRELELTYERATAARPEDRFPGARELAESATAALELAASGRSGPLRAPAPIKKEHFAASMAEFERTLPLPIATSVRLWGWRFGRERDTRSFAEGATWVLEATVTYLLNRALALSASRSRDMTRFSNRRMLTRPGLGGMYAALRELESDDGEGPPSLTAKRAVGAAFENMISFRNNLAHGRQPPQTLAAEVEAEVLPSLMMIFERIREDELTREESLVQIDEVLAVGSLGSMGGGFRLVGSQPSGWERFKIGIHQPAEVPGIFLMQRGQLIRMWPFAVPAPEAPHVLLFRGFSRDQIEQRSTDPTDTGRHLAFDEERRKVIDALLGPEVNYALHCPNCQSGVDDIVVLGSYFDIYKCAQCEMRYCYKCPGSSNGRQCPHCGNVGQPATVGRVVKG